MSGYATRIHRLRRRAVQGAASDLELEEIRRYEAKSPSNRPRKWKRREKAAPPPAPDASPPPGATAPGADAAPLPEPEVILPPPTEVPTAIPPPEATRGPEEPRDSSSDDQGDVGQGVADGDPGLGGGARGDASGGAPPLGAPGPIALLAAQSYGGLVRALNEQSKELGAPIVLSEEAIEGLTLMCAHELQRLDELATPRQILIGTPAALLVQNVTVKWIRKKREQAARNAGPSPTIRGGPPPNGAANGVQQPRPGPEPVPVPEQQEDAYTPTSIYG